MKPQLKLPVEPTILKFPTSESLEIAQRHAHAHRLRKHWTRLTLVALIGFWLNISVAVYALSADNWWQFGLAILWTAGCIAGGIFFQYQVRKLNTLLDA